MISKLFKSGFLLALLLLASCSLRTARDQSKPAEPSPVAHAPAQENGPGSTPIEIPADPPPHTAEESLDNGARIVLKPKDPKKGGKSIEITDNIRSTEKEPALKSSDDLAAEAAQAQAAALKRIETISEKASAPKSLEQAPAESENGAEATTATVQPSRPAPPKITGVEPVTALKWLKNGNRRFSKGWLRKDGQAMKDVTRVAKSTETPHTIVISCSDSRVPPEIVFDQKLGEIFVIRTAGNVLDTVGIASIEHAVQNLGARLVLVMGHSSCDAVKTAVATPVSADAGSKSLNRMVAELHPFLRGTIGPDAKPSKGYEKEGWSVAKGVAADLVNRSEIIRQAVESGNLMIKSSLYHLDSGTVDFE